MRYRQNTKGDILYSPRVSSQNTLLVVIKIQHYGEQRGSHTGANYVANGTERLAQGGIYVLN